MVLIETTIFSKLLGEHLNDDESQLLQKHLMLNLKDGKIIVGSGGGAKIALGVGVTKVKVAVLGLFIILNILMIKFGF